ncbi:MAG TPA: DNA polymerase, partial [Methylomirabilota bacterium]|nr:DNA polymerase [Methylomirabilota bacterium]
VGSVEREAMNHPIQAANADATKLATIIAVPHLHKLHPECIIIAWCHDEIILTAPEEVIEQAAEILKNSMIESARQQLKNTPVAVSITISNCWGKG